MARVGRPKGKATVKKSTPKVKKFTATELRAAARQLGSKGGKAKARNSRKTYSSKGRRNW